MKPFEDLGNLTHLALNFNFNKLESDFPIYISNALKDMVNLSDLNL